MPHDPDLDPNLDHDLDPISEDDDVELLDDRPGWPKPVGILSIVFASLALTCGILGTGMVFASDTLMNAAMGGQLDGAPPPPQAPPADAVFIASVVMSIAMNILLLIAGIGLLRRWYGVRKLFLVYAVAGLIGGGFAVYAQLHGQVKQTQAMERWIDQHGDTNDVTRAISDQYQAQQSSAATMSLVGIVAGIVIGGAWPVFCAVWFGAVKAREHTWTGAPPEDPDASINRD